MNHATTPRLGMKVNRKNRLARWFYILVISILIALADRWGWGFMPSVLAWSQLLIVTLIGVYLSRSLARRPKSNYLECILSSLPEGYVLLDRHKRILAANALAVEPFGLEAETLVGAHLSEVLGLSLIHI